MADKRKIIRAALLAALAKGRQYTTVCDNCT